MTNFFSLPRLISFSITHTLQLNHIFTVFAQAGIKFQFGNDLMSFIEYIFIKKHYFGFLLQSCTFSEQNWVNLEFSEHAKCFNVRAGETKSPFCLKINHTFRIDFEDSFCKRLLIMPLLKETPLTIASSFFSYEQAGLNSARCYFQKTSRPH